MITADYRKLLLGLTVLTSPLFMHQEAEAQNAPPSSQLELRRSTAGNALAGAMSQLARQPRDVDALITAGEAALRLEDPRSAIGFFGRADDVSPNNGRVKAGLGRSMLQLEQIGDGLRLMEEAGKLGYSDPDLFADRGLARDLTGNQTGAQSDYRQALALDPKNEAIIRRYAVSLGISGQIDLAESTIKPLLYASNRAAWRDQAFILAMNGRTADALDITGKVMPRPLADAIKPYMERMGMLTPGQRAAAVHLGQFPPGLVNMRIASVAVPVKPVAPAPVEEVRKGKRKAAKTPRSERTRKDDATRIAAASSAQPPQERIESGTGGGRSEAADPSSPPPIQSRERASSSAPAASARKARNVRSAQAAPAPAPTTNLLPASSSASAREVQGPSVPQDRPVAQAAPAAASQQQSFAASQSAPDSGTSPIPPGESTRSLADIMAEIKIPEAERKHDVAPVNLAEIMAAQAKQRKAEEAAAKEAVRKKAEEEVKAKAKAAAEAEKKRLAANPARYWLQIGVGQKQNALAFTLRRMKKEHDVLGKYDGWSASWGQTNRLLVGPFSNLDKAKAAEVEMRKGGSDAFVWHSDAGEEVQPVGGK